MLKNERGFTLIEMLIVLMIISVLLILIVPNLTDKGKEVYSKGCDAQVAVVQGQADTYTIETGEKPASLDILVSGNYITEEQTSCQNGKTLTIKDGKVSAGTKN